MINRGYWRIHYRIIGRIRLLIIGLIIIIFLIPINLIAEKKGLQYYENKKLEGNVYQETFVFYGNAIDSIGGFFTEYDSMFVNLEKVLVCEDSDFKSDSLYQVDGFISYTSQWDRERKEKMLNRRSRELSKDKATFYNKFDYAMRWVTGAYCLSIVGIPVAFVLCVIYGIKWLFDKAFEEVFL
ncbi:MAG: hypothetical protein SVK54_07960 [candidate division WOR-3 bacterium]|nr:hypothetical protein [candidate division WOR-3 bacterium]